MRGGAEQCRRLGIRVSGAHVAAFNCLEARGLRFGIEFGYQNAIALARQVWQRRKVATDRKRRRLHG